MFPRARVGHHDVHFLVAPVGLGDPDRRHKLEQFGHVGLEPVQRILQRCLVLRRFLARSWLASWLAELPCI